MKYKGENKYELDNGEPALSSCPKCNSAHEHLLDTTFLHYCFGCGGYWIHGKYLSDFPTEKDMDNFLRDTLEHI